MAKSSKLSKTDAILLAASGKALMSGPSFPNVVERVLNSIELLGGSPLVITFFFLLRKVTSSPTQRNEVPFSRYYRPISL